MLRSRSRLGILALVLLCLAGSAFLLTTTPSFRRVIAIYQGHGPGAVLRAVVQHVAPAPAPPATTFHGDPFGPVLHRLATQPSFNIVQLGAYVGDSPNDPLFAFLKEQMSSAKNKHGSKAVLVEPIKEYFERLKQNYAGSLGIQFANVAIAESEGMRDFYTLNADPVKYGYPAWLSQLSSLKSERMGKLWDQYERTPEFKRFYLEHRTVEKVKCITIGQLLRQYRMENLDLLLLDVEGYEFEILKTLDFSRIRPRFIDYERVLLQENEAACREMLEKHGYILIDWGQDTLAIRVD
jgi:FkbM family methyltransferase